MTEKRILQEAVEYNEKVRNTIIGVMEDYDPCDFEDFMEYTEAVIDYTLGRLGFDPYDEENEEYTTSQETNSQLNEDINLEFIEGHEARMFTKLSKLKQWVVPMMFYDGDRICKIELLDLGRTETNPIAKEFREEYAKTALMMFYPFRDKADLMINNSHWILFEQELNKDAEENVIFSLLLSALHEVFLSSRSELHLARK